MNDLYSELILENARYPRNKLKGKGLGTSIINDVCGDSLTLYIELNSDQQVEKCSFEGQCCALATASASLFTTWLLGKDKVIYEALTPKDIYTLVAIPLQPVRAECVLLVFRAFQKYQKSLTNTC